MSGLLDLVLDAHGGLARWGQVESLDVRVSLTGGLFALKGYPDGVPDVTMRIDAHRPSVVISPYARPDHRGCFTPERVWIEDRDGAVVEERHDPRGAMVGQLLETPWDQLHRLYFTGYAVWNYLTTPFLFTRPGFETEEIEPHRENGDTWRCLRVRFPADVHTHNNYQPGGEQTFFFSDDGLLRRLDYLAAGPGAHYCWDHASFAGIVIPTLRRVVPRPPAGPLVNGPTAVLIRITDVVVA